VDAARVAGAGSSRLVDTSLSRTIFMLKRCN
jgi:hypothetical protein